MLVLSRKKLESIVVNGTNGFDRKIIVTVLEIKGRKVRLGFDAAADVPIHRMELWERGRAKSCEPDPQPLAERANELPPYYEQLSTVMK